MSNYKNIKQLKNFNDFATLPWQTNFEVYDRIIDWAPHLANHQQLQEFKTLALDFYNSQEKEVVDNLIAQRQNHDSSWLWQWWIQYVYLSGRKAPTPEANAPFLNKYSKTQKYDALEVLAITVNRLSQYYLDFYNKTFNHQKIDKIFSDQIYGLFAAMRLPKPNFDDYFISNELSQNIIFMYQNTSYEIQVIENNQVLDSTIILNTLKNIVANHQFQDSKFNYILSLNDRELESKVLKKLLEDSQNQKSFEAIKKSIGVFAYDKDFKETSKEAIFHNSVANDKYLNRWNGKALQLTIDDNKNIVLLIDHSFVDAATYGELFNDIDKEFGAEVAFFQKQNSNLQQYQILKFNILDEQHFIEKKYQKFIDYKNSVATKAVKFNWLKRSQLKTLGVKGIDAFLQLGYQRAQHLTNQQIRNTYVAVDMRQFFGGRTECIRPISTESLDFVHNMDQYLKEGKSVKTQLNQLYDIHYLRIKGCQKGYGVNRHILGLKLILVEKGNEFKLPKLAKLLQNPLIAAISANPISTSTINYTPIKYGYFYPVEADGIGIFYITVDDIYRAMVTAWANNKDYLDKFVKNLEIAYKELLTLIKLD